jgi:hypothetical protein
MNVKARIILILIIGTSLCAACQQETITSAPDPTATMQPTETPQLDRDIEESAVYKALLKDSFRGDFIEQYLIMDQTRVNHPALLEQDLENLQEYKPLDEGLMADFLAVNQQPSPLEPILDIDLEYQLLTQEEIDELRPLDEESGWQLYYEKFPNAVGFIYFSRVGFNADLTQALVYYEQYRYDQPITGGYQVLNRQDGEWVGEYGYQWDT